MKRLLLLLFLSASLFATGCMPNFCNLKSSADCSVKNLSSDSAGQLLIGQLVEAVNSELMLVDLLISNKTGAVIAEKIHDRNVLLNITDPAVVDAYCKIMEIATYSEKLMQQCYCNNNCLNPCPTRLGCKDRRCFLHCTRYILGCYQQQLRCLQCKLAFECCA